MRSISKALNLARTWCNAFAYFAYLLTVGLFHRSDRALLRETVRVLRLAFFPRHTVPDIAISELVGGELDICLTSPDETQGNVTLAELVVISSLVRRRAPSALFEIGTFDGRTTLALAHNAPGDATIYTLDLPPKPQTVYALDPRERAVVIGKQVGWRFRGQPQACQIQQLYGDSVTFDYGPYQSQIDLVFIDASHVYEAVRADTLHALDLLRDGHGIILWHDYPAWEGVWRAVNELAASDPRMASVRHIPGTNLAYLSC